MKATFAFLQQTINKILNEIDDSTFLHRQPKSTLSKSLSVWEDNLEREEKKEKRKKNRFTIHYYYHRCLWQTNDQKLVGGRIMNLVFYECVRVGRFAMKDVERDTDWDKETGAPLILRLYWIAIVYYENFYGLKKLSFAILNDIDFPG